MKLLDFSLSENIYASLVTGHARAGNIEAAERVITNMKASNQRPHNVTYTSLLCAYAERGDIDAIEKVRG
jgi:leucine-rich PPR motif-containing protein